MTHAHRRIGLLLMAMLAPGDQPARVSGSATSSPVSCSRSPASATLDGPTSDEFAERLWCAAPVPDAVRESPRIVAAIARMRRLGGVCARLAARLIRLQQRGLIRLFDPAAYPGVGGAAPVDPTGGAWLLLSRDLVTTFYDAAHRSGNVDSRGLARPETVQSVLAHEADHLDGADHIDNDGYLTPNTRRCGDLP